MNALDTTLVVIIAVFAIRGMFRGLITELTVLVALITGYILGFRLLLPVSVFLIGLFPSLPPFAAKIIAFAIVFVSVNIVLRMGAKALNKFASVASMQGLNRFAGGLFAAAKAAFFISIVFIGLELLPFTNYIKQNIGTTESSFYTPLRGFAPAVYNGIAYILPGDSTIQQKLDATLQKADSTAKNLIPPLY